MLFQRTNLRPFLSLIVLALCTLGSGLIWGDPSEINGRDWAFLRAIKPSVLSSPPKLEALEKQLRITLQERALVANQAKRENTSRWLIEVMDLQYSRFLERTSFESNGLLVEITDTTTEKILPEVVRLRLEAKGISPEAWIKDPDNKSYDNALPVYEAQDFAAKEGQEIQKAELKEISNFIDPSYKERRGWKPEFIEGAHEKTFWTMDFTRYIKVRDPVSKKLIGLLGIVQTTYRKIQYFNSRTQRWEEETLRIPKENLGKAAQNQLALWSIDTSESTRMLPLEDFFGEKAFVPRPSVIESIWHPHELSKDTLQAMKKRNVDTTKPIFTFVGQISELTKYGVDQNFENRGGVFSNIFRELHRAVFHSGMWSDFIQNGQAHYQFNDIKGQSLFRRVGFREVPIKSTKAKLAKWMALGITPETLAATLSNSTLLRQRRVDCNSYLKEAQQSR